MYGVNVHLILLFIQALLSSRLDVSSHYLSMFCYTTLTKKCSSIGGIVVLEIKHSVVILNIEIF